MNNPIKDGILPDENILSDYYPVNYGYLYVCDSKVRSSPIGGGCTVRDLKRELNVKEVRRCNMIDRNLF
jgi:hypothetical protein